MCTTGRDSAPAADSIGSGEILPLQQYVRPAFDDSRHESLDELVVFGAANALVAPPDIEGVRQPLRVVGADIEQDRQRLFRVNSGAGRIERQLADRNPHSAGALVTETENPFPVADDDSTNLVV